MDLFRRKEIKKATSTNLVMEKKRFNELNEAFNKKLKEFNRLNDQIETRKKEAEEELIDLKTTLSCVIDELRNEVELLEARKMIAMVPVEEEKQEARDTLIRAQAMVLEIEQEREEYLELAKDLKDQKKELKLKQKNFVTQQSALKKKEKMLSKKEKDWQKIYCVKSGELDKKLVEIKEQEEGLEKKSSEVELRSKEIETRVKWIKDSEKRLKVEQKRVKDEKAKLGALMKEYGLKT